MVAAPQLSSMHEVAAAIQRWIQPRCKAAAYGPCSPVGPKTRLAAAFPPPSRPLHSAGGNEAEA